MRSTLATAGVVALSTAFGAGALANDAALTAIANTATAHAASDGPIEFQDMEVRVDHADWEESAPSNDGKKITVCVDYIVGQLGDSGTLQPDYTDVAVQGKVVTIDANGREKTLIKSLSFTIVDGFFRKCISKPLKKMRGVVRIQFRHTSVSRNVAVDGTYFCELAVFRAATGRVGGRKGPSPEPTPRPLAAPRRGGDPTRL